MEATKRAAAKLVEDAVPARLAAKDQGLWGPKAEPIAQDRLGWLAAPKVSRRLLGEFARLTERVRQDRLEHIVLAGMGGSSLAPEVITRTAGTPLTVLDTTDPHQVANALCDRLDRTLVIVSSKSGSTIETDSHRRIYEQALHGLGLTHEEIARRFVIVTDPGSPLEEVARKAGYHVVLADPDVGGRYSALTAFGLMPSAIAGVDVAALLDQAEAVMPALCRDDDNPGLVLGAALGGFAMDGHDKAVIAGHGSGIPGFGDWAEQLLAESTGKQGLGHPARGGRIGSRPRVLPWPGHSPGRARVRGAQETPGGAAALVHAAARGHRGRRTARRSVPGVGIRHRAGGPDNRHQPVRSAERAGVQGQHGRPAGQGRRRAAAGRPGRPSLTASSRCTQILNGCAARPTSQACWTSSSGRCQTGVTWRSWPISTVGDSDAARLRAALAVRTTHPVTFGWGPASCTRPASFTRAVPRMACSCRSLARSSTTYRFQARHTRWAGCSLPRRSVTSARSVAAAARPSGCTCATGSRAWRSCSAPQQPVPQQPVPQQPVPTAGAAATGAAATGAAVGAAATGGHLGAPWQEAWNERTAGCRRQPPAGPQRPADSPGRRAVRLVIFGVTGDLARKKLMPAIYDLANRGLLPPGFSLVGFARRNWADEDFAQVTHRGREGTRAHAIQG